MKRLVNFRFPLAVAVSLAVGILCGYKALFGNYVYLIVSLAFICVVALLLAIAKTNKAWTALLALIFLAVGYLLIQNVCKREQAQAILNQQLTVTGRVCDVGRNGNQNKNVVLQNCVTDDGVKLNGKLSFYAFDEIENYETGNVVTVRGVVNGNYAVTAKVNSYYYRNDIAYSMSQTTLLQVDKGEMRLDEKARYYVYDVTQKYMPNCGDTMYALLTGDRNAMDEQSKEAFSRAGVTHLLAVSGLHVGFVVAVLAFFVKRLRLNVMIEFLIVALPLVFYAYVCNFAPSVVRAIVMLACVYFVQALHGKYDLLTSLSVAVSVLLLAKPLYLFDAGFQLSALSVFGIATIYNAYSCWAKQRKFGKVANYLLSSVALSFACSVSTLFLVAITFGQVPLFGVLVNVIAIPLASVTYVVGAFGQIPFVGVVLLKIADGLLLLLQRLANVVASLSFATVAVVAVGASVAIAMAVSFVVGGYVNLGKKAKFVVVTVLCLLLVGAMVTATLPKNTKEQVFVSVGYDDVAMVATDKGGNVAIVSDLCDGKTFDALLDFVKQYKVNSCFLFVAHFENVSPVFLQTLLQSVRVDGVYLMDFSANDNASWVLSQRKIKAVRQGKNSAVGSGVVVKSYYDGQLRSAVVSVGKVTVASVFGGQVGVYQFAGQLSGVDVYAMQQVTDNYPKGNLTTLSVFQNAFDYNYGANKYGNFTITQKDGKIVLQFR